MSGLVFPTRRVREVWHTGTLNPADKRPGSYEGAGLSVSRHPDAWERIARGRIQGVRHRLTCADGLFLDAKRMTRTHRDAIRAWALAERYIREARLYEIAWYDDELESRMTAEFTSAAKARRESHDGRFREKAGLVATRRLKRRTGNDWDPVDISRDVAPLYAEDVLDLDGTWWADRLDVLAYTAPCGVIAPSRLARWTVHSPPADRDLERIRHAA